MPLNGWGGYLSHHWATAVKGKGWGRDSSNQSEILHVDSYISNKVFLFFELYRISPLSGWGACCPTTGQQTAKAGMGQGSTYPSEILHVDSYMSIKVFWFFEQGGGHLDNPGPYGTKWSFSKSSGGPPPLDQLVPGY